MKSEINSATGPPSRTEARLGWCPVWQKRAFINQPETHLISSYRHSAVHALRADTMTIRGAGHLRHPIWAAVGPSQGDVTGGHAEPARQIDSGFPEARFRPLRSIYTVHDSSESSVVHAANRVGAALTGLCQAIPRLPVFRFGSSATTPRCETQTGSSGPRNSGVRPYMFRCYR